MQALTHVGQAARAEEVKAALLGLAARSSRGETATVAEQDEGRALAAALLLDVDIRVAGGATALEAICLFDAKFLQNMHFLSPVGRFPRLYVGFAQDFGLF